MGSKILIVCNEASIQKARKLGQTLGFEIVDYSSDLVKLRSGNERPFLIGLSGHELLRDAEVMGQLRCQLQHQNLHIGIVHWSEDKCLGVIITPEGGRFRFNLPERILNKKLADFIEKRTNVHWYKSVVLQGQGSFSLSYESEDLFSRLLGFGQRSGLLHDNSGNVSVRGIFSIKTTPRNVDKSKILATDCPTVNVDHGQFIVRRYSPTPKQSIDAPVMDKLMLQKEIDGLIHFHQPWGRADDGTLFPYPCGTLEEADEIIKLYSLRSRSNFMIELSGHGFLLGLIHEFLPVLEAEWTYTCSLFDRHLGSIGKLRETRSWLRQPIWAGTHIVGVVMHMPRQSAVVLYLNPEFRRNGIGRVLLGQIVDRRIKVVSAPECNVQSYYGSYGFEESEDESGLLIFTPPNPASHNLNFD